MVVGDLAPAGVGPEAQFAELGLEVAQCVALGSCPAVQVVGDLLVELRVEEGLEQHLALVRAGAEHLLEAALGQQDDLGELLGGQSDQLAHLLLDVADARCGSDPLVAHAS